jgi:Tol biopolymer transport system component
MTRLNAGSKRIALVSLLVAPMAMFYAPSPSRVLSAQQPTPPFRAGSALIPLRKAERPAVVAYQRVSIAGDGTQANGRSRTPSLSGDGRCIAFESEATNLGVGPDTNDGSDIFVFDRVSGLTTRESVSSAGAQANGPSFTPAMGGNCDFVSFLSTASNLVAGVSGPQVYVRNRTTGSTVLGSLTGAGVPGNGQSGQPVISFNNRFVAFASLSDNLVGGDTNGVADVFLHDIPNGPTTRESVSSGALQATGGLSTSPSLSQDARYVAFDSDANDLVSGDVGGRDVFVRDRDRGVTTLESVGSTGIQLNGEQPSISSDGRFLAFHRNNTELYLRDRTLGTTVGIAAVALPSVLRRPMISADGRYVSFSNGAAVQVFDRTAGVTTTIDASAEPTAVVGNVLAFSSTAALTAGDTNSVADVFIAAIDSNPSPAPAPTGIPGTPSGLTATINGLIVTLTWTAPATGGAPSTYVIDAGTTPGTSDAAVLSTGSTATSFAAQGPANGRFFVRVRAVNSLGSSGPSNEVIVAFGPSTVPASPTGLVSAVSGSTVTLAWTAPAGGGTPTVYIIEAGSSPGLANLANFSTGNTATAFSASGVSAGSYFVRVRAANASGVGPASNEVLVIVQ